MYSFGGDIFRNLDIGGGVIMKTKNLSFMEAVKAMKEGKKVRRPCYGLDISDSLDSWNISYTMEDFEATDWEIVEEKQTLSDKEFHFTGTDERAYYKKDVKEALKRTMNDIELMPNVSIPSDILEHIRNSMKKRFGERLL